MSNFKIDDMVQLKKGTLSRVYSADRSDMARVYKLNRNYIFVKWEDWNVQNDGDYPIKDFKLLCPEDKNCRTCKQRLRCITS